MEGKSIVSESTALAATTPVEIREVAGTVLPEHVPSFLPEGIYIGLDEDTYHNDPALGSTDMKRLAQSPPDFWFNSKFNPDWESDDEDTPSRKFGRAAHKRVLEGRDVFLARYGSVSEPGNTKAGKDQRAAIEARGKEWLKSDDFRRIELMGAMVRGNPALTNAFTGGVAGEVSIFWQAKNGMRKKCRIDYLKPRASVDLKTIANQFNEPFPQACRKAIGNYRYDVQAAHYAEGRAQMARLLGAVNVCDGSSPDLALLKRCAMEETFWWVFVFVQSVGAPLTWGATLAATVSRKGADGTEFEELNPILDIGRRTIEVAEFNWAANCKKFDGLRLPWVLDEPLAELAIEDFPAWAFR